MDPFDFEAMSEAQKVDAEILNSACSDDHSLDLKYVTIPGTEKQYYCWETHRRDSSDLWSRRLYEKKCLKHFIFRSILE